MKSTRTYLAVFFFLTTVGALLLAYHQYKTYIELQAQLNDPKTGLERQLADDQKVIKELRDQLAVLRKSGGDTADDMAADDPAAGDQGGDRNARRQAFRNAMRAVFNSPQFQALRSVQEKAQLDQRYAALFKNLSQNMGLSPQQLDQFKNLLVQKQQASDDARQAAMQNGLNPRTDAAAFNQAVTDATTDVDNQIKAAVGDAAFSQYQDFNQTTPQRNTVSQLQQSLSYSTTPLTDDQANQLIALMQQNTPASTTTAGGFRGGGGPGGFGGGTGGTAPITNQEITAAASILSSSQVQALQQLQQTQQAQQQMNQLMRSAIGQTRGNRGGGG